MDLILVLLGALIMFLALELFKELWSKLKSKHKYGEERIVRWVRVDRSWSPEAIRDILKRKHIFLHSLSDLNVMSTMPRGEGEDKNVKVHFFPAWGRNHDELEKEYERRNLRAADPYTLIAFNVANPSFTEKYPNGTHWRDSQGRWCYAYQRFRSLIIERNNIKGLFCWWAGLPK